MRGLIDTFSSMYPQLQEIDFRRDVTRLEVPYVMLDGGAELASRRALALEWYAQFWRSVICQGTYQQLTGADAHMVLNC